MARLRGLLRPLAGLGSGFAEAFLRNNRVLPPVLALLALFLSAWILAGMFLGGGAQESAAQRADLAQSNSNPRSDPVSPDIENRDVESYAAYRSKDPFRQLIAPTQGSHGQTTPETTTPEDTRGTGTQQGSSSTNGAAGNRANKDSDNDGLSDRREQALGTDPNNPDTDNDGLTDGDDDANGDSRPDGGRAGASNGANSVQNNAGGAGGRGGRVGSGGDRGGRPGRGGDLLNSGGTLSPP